MCAIADERTTLEKRLEELKDRLPHIGYSLNLIKESIEKAKGIPQEILCPNIKKEKAENLLTFAKIKKPRYPNMFSITK